MIEAHALEKRFGTTIALRGFELCVTPGEIAGLVGHNGAGKTTFARALAGVIALDGGRVAVAGIDVAADPQAARARLGIAPQELALVDSQA
jgi:ABC-2 type transport system ATP-binding protein